MSKIIAPNGAVNSYLEDKEKKCHDKIMAVLEEENCFINPIVLMSYSAQGANITNVTWATVAMERLPKDGKSYN